VPEFRGLALAVGVCVPAVLWYQGVAHSTWQRTTGHVTQCEVRETHYNATDEGTKVSLTYRYDVLGIPFTASWTGFWPEADEQSPNALAPSELHNLQTPEYPLVVFYDPNNPTSSLIHTGNVGDVAVYKWLFGGLFALTMYYIIRVYPAWKNSSPSR
jgi:hypothetical protein